MREKHVFFCIFLTLILPFALSALDLGVYGKTFQVKEPNLLDQIHEKLFLLEQNGTLAAHQEKMVEEAQKRIRRPKKVEGISPSSAQRIYTYDPTIQIQKDIKDHKGRIIHPKGTEINPLHLKPYTKEMLFIDGDQQKEGMLAFLKLQKTLLKKKEDKNPSKGILIILVNGSPLDFETAVKDVFKKEGKDINDIPLPIYFDQGGRITKKFGILHTPALLYQKKDEALLEIEENTPEAFLAKETSIRDTNIRDTSIKDTSLSETGLSGTLITRGLITQGFLTQGFVPQRGLPSRVVLQRGFQK